MVASVEVLKLSIESARPNSGPHDIKKHVYVNVISTSMCGSHEEQRRERQGGHLWKMILY